MRSATCYHEYMADSADLLTTPAVARLLGRPRMTIYRWAVAGRIPATRTASGFFLFLRRDVTRFAKETGLTIQAA